MALLGSLLSAEFVAVAVAYVAVSLTYSFALKRVPILDVIVLGGGVSNLEHCYREVPRLMEPWIFGDSRRINIVQAKHGDSSGVFGAARLWDHG